MAAGVRSSGRRNVGVAVVFVNRTPNRKGLGTELVLVNTTGIEGYIGCMMSRVYKGRSEYRIQDVSCMYYIII